MEYRRIITVLGATALLTLSTAAKAEEDLWGCEVLLCLSNPSGPMAVNQCVPPIKKLIRALSKTPPEPFPKCNMANGPGGTKNYAAVDYRDVYDDCPKDWVTVANRRYVQQGTKEEWNEVINNPRKLINPGTKYQTYRLGYNSFRSMVSAKGIGDGQSWDTAYPDYYPDKVCATGYLGTGMMQVGWDEFDSEVDVYEQVKTISPVQNNFSIKVFVDGKLYTKVRPNMLEN